MHTYAFRLREVTTYIGIESLEKECGKSTLLTVLSHFVDRAAVSSNISSSAFFTAIEELQPTLLIEEADTNLRGKHDLTETYRRYIPRSAWEALRAEMVEQAANSNAADMVPAEASRSSTGADGQGKVAGSGLQQPGSGQRKGPDVFTRLGAALNMDGKRRLRTAASPEEFGDVVSASAKEPEGAARLVGNGQTAVVVGRDVGSAGLKGGAPSAEKQTDQKPGE